MAANCLVRPAAAEVRAMLQKIKLDNMERGRKMAIAAKPIITVNKRSGFYEHQQMGSFTSMPKIRPAPNSEDNDVDYGNGENIGLDDFLNKCRLEMGASMPNIIPRKFRHRRNSLSHEGFFNDAAFSFMKAETIRVFQWNALSQALGTGNDNFVKCPPSALDWKTRRFRMLEEIARHNADVICLQEIDHFNFLRKSLAALGYVGHFTPKPDSPCLYLPNNSGPDGCAIFYKKDKFDCVKIDSRVLEVWKVQSNQVVLSATLRSKKTNKEVVVATTHLKARNGVVMPTLRNEQGRDLMEFLSDQARGRPTICTGDFNAEPGEPVYQTMTAAKSIRLNSAYKDVLNQEPNYTTWKFREDGEHIQTLDYIFYNPDQIKVESILDMPTGDQIGETKLPNLAYASDHFSLVADLKLIG